MQFPRLPCEKSLELWTASNNLCLVGSCSERKMTIRVHGLRQRAVQSVGSACASCMPKLVTFVTLLSVIAAFPDTWLNHMQNLQ